MPIDQGTRVEVYEALKTAHGEKVANAFMEMLPPAGVPELATKADVALLGADLRAEIAQLRGEFGERLERGLREQTTRFVAWMFAVVGISSTIVAAAARLA